MIFAWTFQRKFLWLFIRNYHHFTTEKFPYWIFRPLIKAKIWRILETCKKIPIFFTISINLFNIIPIFLQKMHLPPPTEMYANKNNVIED